MTRHNSVNGYGRVLLAATLMLVAGSLAAGCNSRSLSDGLGPTGSTSARQQTVQPLRPDAPVGTETALAPEPQAPQAGAQAALQRNTVDPVDASIPPVAFLPVTGAPQSTVASLASSMRRAAQEKSVPVVVSTQQGAQYQIKGYFSALADGDGTLLVYVWDVLDRNGTRIHRISGQERAGRVGGGDPWAGVTDDVIERVSQTTMSSLRSWMRTRRAG